MKPATLKALRGSIKKWQGIRAGTMEDLGADNCPLCKLFLSREYCSGCPVAGKTGQDSCNGSPYELLGSFGSYIRNNKSLQNIVADAEILFLKALLPKRRAKK